MTGSARLLRRGLFVLLTAGVLAVPATAQTKRPDALRITLDEARQAAANALMAGRAEDALILSQGVLLGAPEDKTALFIKARALRQLGKREAAVETARVAWQTSDTPRDRFYSAMMMAQMRSFAGQNGVAQLWLRRAMQLAPDDRLKEIAVEDFRHVRRITPWRFAMDLFVQPSDNLNNAPTEDTPVPGGVVKVTPPLSGLRYGAGVQMRYIKPLAPRVRLQFSGFAQGSAVRLSDEAKDVPGAEAGDYTSAVLGGAVTLEGIAKDGGRLGRAHLSLRRQWQGGAPIADIARLDLGLDQRLSPTVGLGLRLGFEDVKRLDSPVGDAQRRDAGLSLTKRFEHGALTLDMGVGETFSAAYNVGRQDGSVGLSYAFARPVAGVLPTLSFDYGVYNYDAPWIGAPDGPAREDRQRRIGVDLLLPQLDYYGFAPEVGVSFTDRNSNYNLYENRSTDLRFGLKSVF